MFDKELVLDILNQIEISAKRMVKRFEKITSVSDFTDSPDGIYKMDSICMMLIMIGESLKNLDKITRVLCLGNILKLNGKKQWECEIFSRIITRMLMPMLFFIPVRKRYRFYWKLLS